MRIVGFDFGTTNSLISVVSGDRAISFLDDEGLPVPSIVCYEGAQKIVGREAKGLLHSAGLGVQDNIIRSPKMYLGEDSIFVEGIERSPVDVVSAVVGHVLREAKASTTRGRDLNEIDGAVVTIPVDMEGYKRRALRDAFRLAGLNIVQFVHEPLAALYGLFRSQDLSAMLRRYDGKLILVFDWGGGTLDLTLCRPIDGMVVQLMNDGTDEVGGDVFDESIMNNIVKTVALKRGFQSSVETQPGALARLIDRCERAKIDLSERDRVAIYLRSFFRNVEEEELDYSLSRDGLEEIVNPLLEKGFSRIKNILENAGYSADQVALCLATGGMSNMPAVKRRLHEWFGPERVRIPKETGTLIAEGAAWIAADKAGLQLAKTVELVLARNSYLPLVKAGALMPAEGEIMSQEFHLYCTDPRDGVAKFQITAPKRSGSNVLPGEPRTHLENLTVNVDEKAHAFRERLELDVRIDDDLILTAYARSLNAEDKDQKEIHNLEFGLSFPSNDQIEEVLPSSGGTMLAAHEDSESGSLVIRSNVADKDDLALVPGEYLYTYQPRYFDIRSFPPQEQVEEKLYYQACSGCGRSSNDPACRCESELFNGDDRH